MAIKRIPSKRIYNNREKFIMDSEADVTSLPQCCTGSIAIVAKGGKTYMVNASGEWVEAGTATFSIAEEASF